MSLARATASWATSATLACPAVCATREVPFHQEGPAPAGLSLAYRSVSGALVGLRSIIASGPLLTLIHPSSWNRNSPKFRCRIVHRSPSERHEDGFQGPSRRGAEVYILWPCPRRPQRTALC